MWGGWRVELGTLGQSPVSKRSAGCRQGLGAVSKWVQYSGRYMSLSYRTRHWSIILAFIHLSVAPAAHSAFSRGIEPMTMWGCEGQALLKSKPLEL